jgi:hypothetical protein
MKKQKRRKEKLMKKEKDGQVLTPSGPLDPSFLVMFARIPGECLLFLGQRSILEQAVGGCVRPS